MSRINDAFTVWNELIFSEMEFQTITTSHITNERQVDNNVSVILWQNWTPGVLAQEFPHPEEDGIGTKVGSDILFNTLYNNEWYFGLPPSSTRNMQQIDFADILVHELGHTQGLAHTIIPSTIMYGEGYKNITVSPLRTLSDGDMAGAVYQHTASELSGTLPHPVVLSHNRNNFSASGNLIVPAGGKLEIYPGKTLS